MSMRLPPLAPLAVVMAALGVAGCGATTTVGRGRTLRVALGEYRVTPQDARAQAGVLTIVAHNYGRLAHNLVISRHDDTQASIEPIAPGRSDELVVVLSPGTYTIASTVLADRALGAYGTLRVGS